VFHAEDISIGVDRNGIVTISQMRRKRLVWTMSYGGITIIGLGEKQVAYK